MIIKMEMVAKTTFEGTLLYFTNIAILLGVCSMTKTINNNNVFVLVLLWSADSRWGRN